MSAQTSESKALKSLRPRKIILPMLVGLGAIGYLFYSNDELKWDDIVHNVSNANPFWLFMAFIALFGRDIGYIYRIRNLTSKQLSWTSSIYVIILWEFSSAITPSIVGGTTVAIFILNREGLSFGKAIAYAWLTAVLDNLFFVLASLFVIFAIPESFPDIKMEMVGLESLVNVRNIFIASASLIFIYTVGMALGLFFAPRYIKYWLVKLTSIKYLRRFRHGAIESGNEMMIASQELKGMTFKYWMKAIISTLIIWIARYFIVNCLIASFSGVNITEHLMIFGRHVILWVVMLLSPTPGSSGVAEYTFPKFFGDYAGSFSLAVGVFWRLLTYYAYLILGVLVIPRWLARTAKIIKTRREKREKL